MKKIMIRVCIAIAILIGIALVYVFTYVPELSERQGIVEAKLYLGNGGNQPLFVGFGGGDGGNDWVRNYLGGKRDSLNQKGYAVLAIGYFRSIGTQQYLDRVSLDAIRDTIMSVAQHPQIDASKIILFGGSRGGELVLNLASRYPEFNGVIAGSTSHVSFPAITWSANTSSWSYQGEEVTYVPAPLKTIAPALKHDLYTAHSMMLEDKEAVKKAEIKVENINGPVLVISGKEDDQWPAPEMSNRIIERLKEHNFKHYNEHIMLDGGHSAPLKEFHLTYNFLEHYFPVVNE